jgi:hypothetical protein
MWSTTFRVSNEETCPVIASPTNAARRARQTKGKRSCFERSTLQLMLVREIEKAKASST